MNGRVLGTGADPFGRSGEVDAALLEALRRERRHAAVMFLATGMALGIAFSLALDMAIAAAARV